MRRSRGPARPFRAGIWAATPEGFLSQACQYLHPLPEYDDKVANTCKPYVDLTP